MRTNQIELPSYCNFIFLTNRGDAVKIEDGDRRYNVAPRQEQRIEDGFPEILTKLDELQSELYIFVGLLQVIILIILYGTKVEDLLGLMYLKVNGFQMLQQVQKVIFLNLMVLIKLKA